jgi:hypothetical protein
MARPAWPCHRHAQVAASAAIWDNLGNTEGAAAGPVRMSIRPLRQPESGICVSTVSIVGGCRDLLDWVPADQIRATAVVADVTGGSRWRSVADAADGAALTIFSRVARILIILLPARPSRVNVVSMPQGPQKRLRARYVASEGAGIIRPASRWMDIGKQITFPNIQILNRKESD